MATTANRTAIVVAIIGLAGMIVGVTVSLSMAHISNLSIHEEKKMLVKQPEFIQFQHRILDGIRDIQTVQREIRQDIKNIEKSINH